MLEHGDVVRMVIGPPGLRFETTMVFHPDAVQHVLATAADRYSKESRVFRAIADDFGWGLLTSEGELWQRQRRLIQPLFTPRHVAAYVWIMAEEATALADRWPRPGGVVDAHAEMIHLALRVVGRAIFGDDVDEAEDVLRWAFPPATRHAFRRALSPLPLPKSWPTPANREAAGARDAMYAVVDRLIARRRQRGTDKDDLLSRLMSARDAETGAPMAEQQVRDEALIFLLAGHETTSSALTFALYLLAQHVDDQARIRAELHAALGGRSPTYDDVPALARTEMALKEAMRLYPPAYALSRRTRVEDEIGGYRIPAGRIVAVCQWATHRHPEFWPNPQAFDPDRFTPEREAARHRYAYFPFGRGPRACIGSHFAILEALVALAVLLQRFELRATGAPIELNTMGITLRPQGRVPIEVAARAQRISDLISSFA
jgi:cytochrome P450